MDVTHTWSTVSSSQPGSYILIHLSTTKNTLFTDPLGLMAYTLTCKQFDHCPNNIM